jgi:hypothetical protein
VESIQLPYLSGSLTVPRVATVPTLRDADRLVVPAALALLALAVASGGFLSMVYRLGREREGLS